MSDLAKLDLEDTSPGLRAMLQPTVERLGYFGEFFQYAAHAPDVLEGFMKYSGALKSSLPPNLNELIALTVCTEMQLPYERIQHERLSLTLGLDRRWIGELIGRGTGATFTEPECQVRTLCLHVIAGRQVEARIALEALAAAAGNPLAIAVLFQITRFMSVCSIGRVLQVCLPVPSIFEGEPAP